MLTVYCISMAYTQLSDHFANKICQIASIGNIGKHHCILIIYFFPVESVHTGIIKEIPHLSPRFIKDVIPFFRQIDFNLHISGAYCFLNIYFSGRYSYNTEFVSLPYQHLFPAWHRVKRYSLANFHFLLFLEVVIFRCRSTR